MFTEDTMKFEPAALPGWVITADSSVDSFGETRYSVSIYEPEDHTVFAHVYAPECRRGSVYLADGLYGPSRLRAYLIGMYGADGVTLLRRIESEIRSFLNEKLDQRTFDLQ